MDVAILQISCKKMNHQNYFKIVSMRSSREETTARKKVSAANVVEDRQEFIYKLRALKKVLLYNVDTNHKITILL
jgi:hypothetical protein